MPAAYDPADAERSVFDALIDAAQTFGWSKPILEDHERKPLTYRDVVRASFVLGRKFADISEKGERVAVLLPTSAGAAITFFGLHAFGRIPTMLNYSSGLRVLKAAVTLAGVKTVLCSRRFVAQARLEEVVEGLSETCRIVYLEDIRKTVGTKDKLFGLAAGAFPKLFRTPLAPHQAGVVLFTSGSLAAPKGVVLTHRNLCANSAQVAAHIDLDPEWTLFNPLPTFHCFGLNIGVILPLLCGVKSFCYPSPLHTKIIPGLIRDTRASIMITTDTFLNQYARVAEAHDLESLHFVVCGAERVREETHNLMAERFGDVWVLEGYGATEAAPVIAANQPGRNKRGTVGHFMVGVDHKVEPIPGVAGDGRLYVRGPNVMAGYLAEDGSGRVIGPDDGWHDTGDVIAIDDQGYVRIVGRAKRFAKIGGEMVSLSAVEDLCTTLWPESRHAVVSIADARKGERLVLITDAPDATPTRIIEHAQKVGAGELGVPRKIIKVGEVPLLGTGKTDYAAAQRIAEADAMA